MDPEIYPPIVVDNGSSTIRAGLAGNEDPTSVFSNVVGRRRHEIGPSSNFIGDNAQDKRELLNLTYPVDRGIIVNWDDMELVWNHMFYSELKTSPGQLPVLLGEPPFNPKGNREKLAQIMFETYGTPGFTLQLDALLCLMAMGRNCGVVVNTGEGCTSSVTFNESFAPLHAVRRHDFGGKDLTRYLQRLLYDRGYSFTTSAELETVREIKEKMCSVAPHHSSTTGDSPMKLHQRAFEEFKLPDGTSISLGPERYACPEALFTPDGDFIPAGDGIADMVYDSIMSSDISNRADIYANVILSGGSTFFPGFADRLRAELVDRGARKLKRVLDKPERKYHVWIGGSILASLSSAFPVWITRAEYEECGPSILPRKCP